MLCSGTAQPLHLQTMREMFGWTAMTTTAWLHRCWSSTLVEPGRHLYEHKKYKYTFSVKYTGLLQLVTYIFYIDMVSF